MKSKSLALVWGLVSLLWISSCRIPPNIDPETLYGKWKILQFTSSLKEASAPEITKEKDYAAEVIYFDFRSNGSFATNSDLGLSTLLIKAGPEKVGSFTYADVNNTYKLYVSVYDPVIKGDAELTFVVTDADTPNPKLTINTADYKESLTNSANGLATEYKNAILQFSNNITQADFVWKFEKL